jgi:3-oxoacyl-[acyl-carrier protein] reductase
LSLLEDRTALVIGGASGIGRAIAAACVAESATVILPGRSETDAARIGAVDAVPIDVTDEASDTGLLGEIDILVNSAGILTEAPLVEMDLATWTPTLAIDLTGVFLCCRHVVPGMVEYGRGRIINITSQLGIKGGHGLAHYSAAKAGVIALTKSLALEVSGQGRLVNAIAPEPIETPMVEGITDEWKAAKRAELPLGRSGRPEEVAPTAVLPASDPGGNLYVGQTLGPKMGDVMP